MAAAALVDEEHSTHVPGTEPSSRASPASLATPVTVPIVSKKSTSMIEKIDEHGRQDRRAR